VKSVLRGIIMLKDQINQRLIVLLAQLESKLHDRARISAEIAELQARADELRRLLEPEGPTE